MDSVYIELDKGQLDHIERMLRGTPDHALRVVRNSLVRGMVAGRTQATREIRERYDITTENLRPYRTIKIRRPVPCGNGVQGELSFYGTKIPLYRFHPSPAARMYTNRFANGRSGWRITSPVSAADVKGSMRRIEQGFIATFKSGHTGIFYRTGTETTKGTPKIAEKWGFAVKDMLEYPDARQNIKFRMEEITAKRMDHELLRVLKGLY